MSYNAGFDTKILANTLKPKKTTRLGNPWYGGDYAYNDAPSGFWLQEKKTKAELEAHRERVRQVFMRSFGAAIKSSEWVQAIMYVESARNIEELKRVCNSFDIVWKEEGDMVTKNDEINALRSQLADLNKKLSKLENGRMGLEPANGTVFKIEKRYSKSAPGYVFAAVRANGRWYLTGTGVDGRKEYTWEQLKTFIGEYSRVWVMTAKEELVD